MEMEKFVNYFYNMQIFYESSITVLVTMKFLNFKHESLCMQFSSSWSFPPLFISPLSPTQLPFFSFYFNVCMYRFVYQTWSERSATEPDDWFAWYYGPGEILQLLHSCLETCFSLLILKNDQKLHRLQYHSCDVVFHSTRCRQQDSSE